MGFEDHWTAPMGSDSARQAALGDAIHVGTAEWVFRGIKTLHESLPLIGATS